MPISKEQLNEITEAQAQSFTTKRATVPELDNILYEPFPILDHGLLMVIDYMGSDSSIVQAARTSYGKGTKKINEDKGLIEYLIRHRHTTPLEMCEIKLFCRMPIFVARQWIRHRTANVNEYSMRYSIAPDDFYLPEPENIQPQSKENRQGRAGNLSQDAATHVRNVITKKSTSAYKAYTDLYEGKSERPGIARELARIVLPVNAYTEWYWKIDLHNLLHFLSLRMDPHAQYEIRVYADKIGDIVSKWVPMAWHAWQNSIFNAVRFTQRQWDILSSIGIENCKPNKATSFASLHRDDNSFNFWHEENGITRREFNELFDMINALEG